ncbi:hypothetical protein G7054_g9246 [Neopestalotiopsis clavispora]|nr:hypothetical protein G7054_g9246 [Neopestalotiopsis clavispora]
MSNIVLVTGGSGFIAAHIIRTLLQNSYTVVTTVRSPAKGNNVLTSHADISNGKLSYLVVSDITNPKAFEHVFRRGIPFSAVFHTASPFHDNFVDPVDGLLKPAINGTKNILHAIKAYAPTCKRVVITSSFAAIVNPNRPPKIYDESSWNPVSWDEAVTDRTKAYRGSKTHPKLSRLLPDNAMDDFPADVYGYNNARAQDLLGVKFRPLQECIRDTAASLLDLGA